MPIGRNFKSSGNVEDLGTFLRRKEAQYEARRARVADYCRGRSSNFSRQVLPSSLHYNRREGVSVCLIPKVASTTWLGYMAALGIITVMISGKYLLNLFRKCQHEQTQGCVGPQVTKTSAGSGAADSMELGGQLVYCHCQASVL